MAHHLQLQSSKSYATKANAIKAVEKVYGPNEEHCGSAKLRYIIVQGDDGRFFPLFLGEQALREGAHFHFNVAM